MQNTVQMTVGSAFSYGVKNFFHAFLGGFYANRLLYAVSLATYIAAHVVAWTSGLKFGSDIVVFVSVPGLLSYGVFILGAAFVEMIRLIKAKHIGPATPVIWRKISKEFLARQCFVNLLHTFLILYPFVSAFIFFKENIPAINPFAWDVALAETDRMLHGGFYPHEIIAPLFNFPAVTAFINFNYQLWFVMVMAIWLWQGAAAQESFLRQRYLLSFILMWFFGTCVFGVIFSSVGPCFYGLLMPDATDPYASLMAYLRGANETYPVHSLGVMDDLWSSYIKGDGLIAGISAMPSMHVASSVSFIFIAKAAGKPILARFFMLFAALIMIGSVHLGWHYAIDGYVGALIAYLSWKASGYLVHWERRRRGVDDNGNLLAASPAA
jgi:hypothetical protein